MSAELPITLTLDQAHRAATDDANRWRGHCIERYARLERGMTLTLAAIPPGKRGKPATVFGERLKRLVSVVAADGPYPHPKIRKALAEMSSLLEQRNLIVHATGSVYIDREGHWLWRYAFQPSKTGAEEQWGTIARAEGEQMEHKLARSIQSLCGQFTSFRQKLDTPTA